MTEDTGMIQSKVEMNIVADPDLSTLHYEV
jgi:hypothetical protein